MEDAIEKEGSGESPIVHRYGSNECNYWQSVHTAFDEKPNLSVLSSQSKEEGSVDRTISNFSDHFKSYKDIRSFVSTQPPPKARRERVGGSTCHNCLLL